MGEGITVLAMSNVNNRLSDILGFIFCDTPVSGSAPEFIWKNLIYLLTSTNASNL